MDYETGLYYYRARYYDPKAGRFLQRDSIGFEGGINPYVYVDNNTINDDAPFGIQKGSRPSRRGNLNKGNLFPPREEELLPPGVTDPEKKRAPRLPEPPPDCAWTSVVICEQWCCDYDPNTCTCRDKTGISSSTNRHCPCIKPTTDFCYMCNGELIKCNSRSEKGLRWW